jgi:hypothetical protein
MGDQGIEDVPALAGRLVVGTRFGGGVRSRIAADGEVAFAPLPLRAEGLASAFSALGGPRAWKRDEQRIKHERKQRSREAQAQDTRSAAPGAAPIVATQGAASGDTVLALARALEGAASTGAFAQAERVSREAREDAEISESTALSRAVFSALLYARKRDAAGLRKAASVLRSLVEEKLATGETGGGR